MYEDTKTVCEIDDLELQWWHEDDEELVAFDEDGMKRFMECYPDLQSAVGGIADAIKMLLDDMKLKVKADLESLWEALP